MLNLSVWQSDWKDRPADEASCRTRRQWMAVALVVGVLQPGVAGAQDAQAPVATFKSSVDLVRVTAIVRDHKGRFVQDLTVRDFEIIDSGKSRPITEFRRDMSGVSVALLFDVSGSMEGQLAMAREAAKHVLSWLDARDEAAIFTFDTRLEEMMPFTEGMKTLPEAMTRVTPFGATSLHDAIAETARRVESARRTPAGGRRPDRRLRHGEPADARAGVGHRQRNRRAGLSVRHRRVD